MGPIRHKAQTADYIAVFHYIRGNTTVPKARGGILTREEKNVFLVYGWH
jgi:hypothetical protein